MLSRVPYVPVQSAVLNPGPDQVHTDRSPRLPRPTEGTGGVPADH